MTIGGLQKLTLIDYPGKLACTVFLTGCNFRCPWCYSKELVLPEEIKKQPQIPEKDFFAFLKERKGLLEGVTVCGGEPTINKDLPQFCKKIKKLGYLVKLDTNGSNPKMLENLIDKKLIDYVAMDVKLPREKYEKILGREAKIRTSSLRSENLDSLRNKSSNLKLKNIEKSVSLLKENRIDYEFRSTVVPTILNEKDIFKIARWISPAKKYYLQNFRAEKTIEPKFEKIKPYPDKYILDIAKKLSPFFEICELRT